MAGDCSLIMDEIFADSQELLNNANVFPSLVQSRQFSSRLCEFIHPGSRHHGIGIIYQCVSTYELPADGYR